jgi:hypothetical protein
LTIIASSSRSNTADLAGREPDQATLDRLTAPAYRVRLAPDCLRNRRVEISTTLLTENELSGTGVFLYGLYFGTLVAAPRFAEFETDRATLANHKSELEAMRLALASAFVERAEFKRSIR